VFIEDDSVTAVPPLLKKTIFILFRYGFIKIVYPILVTVEFRVSLVLLQETSRKSIQHHPRTRFPAAPALCDVSNMPTSLTP